MSAYQFSVLLCPCENCAIVSRAVESMLKGLPEIGTQSILNTFGQHLGILIGVGVVNEAALEFQIKRAIYHVEQNARVAFARQQAAQEAGEE